MIFARSLRLAARLLKWPMATLLPLTTSAAFACSTVVLGLPERPIVAYSFDLFMRWVERALVPWKGRA